jgi:hypothetical protein
MKSGFYLRGGHENIGNPFHSGIHGHDKADIYGYPYQEPGIVLKTTSPTKSFTK